MDLELEVFKNLFVSVAEEMGATLRLTAFSPNIKERRDYSCAVYDAHARTIAMGDHMPVHLGAMPVAVEAALGQCTLGPGDVVVLNDPFQGGTHLPDITCVAGVFTAGRAESAFYVANRAHHADVGGMAPGSMPLAREIFQEGLRIPPVKLLRAGEWDDSILRMILANVRTPDERQGDLRAQVASLETGSRRLLAALDKHGGDKLASSMDRLLDYCEAHMRAQLATLPDGQFHFVDVMDDDGFGAIDIPIRCAVNIAGDSATVDFAGSAPQTTGGINANRAITQAAVMYAFRCLIEEEIPFNAGLLRPVTIETEAGSIVDALPPASVAAGNVETSQRITDVLLGALAQAAPGQVPAASSGTMNNLSFGGLDPRTGEPFTYYETIAGGMGAGPGADGPPAVHTHMTNSLNTPVEALEHALPVTVERYAVRRASGGAGKYAGGDGVLRELRFDTPVEVNLLSDRRRSQPYGLAGGTPGAPGRNLLDGAEELPAKGPVPLSAGQSIHIETPGGGGFGSRED